MMILKLFSIWALLGLLPAASTASPRTQLSDGARAYDLTGSAISPTTPPRVLFVDDSSPIQRLRSVLLTGGTTVLLSPATVGSGVRSFKVSPDGANVAFLADPVTAFQCELWVVANNGTAATPVAVSGLIAANSCGTTYEWTPDSLRLVFSAQRVTSGKNELFSKLLSSGTVIDLSQLATADRSVSSFRIATNEAAGTASRVVFVADRTVNDVPELFSQPLGGGTPTKLSGATISTAVISDFLIAADGSRVAFRSNRDAAGVIDLYGVPVDGSTAAIKLSGTLLGTSDVGAYRITPDGQRVVFVASRDTVNVFEVYGASATLVGASTKLSGAMLAGASGVFQTLNLTPDGQRVVFAASKDSATLTELYSAPINAANATVKLSDPALAATGVSGFTVCPNSLCVVYTDRSASLKLFSTTVTGGASVDMSAPIGIGDQTFSVGIVSSATAHSSSYRITPDSSRVVNPARARLLSMRIGVNAPLDISGPMIVGDTVEKRAFTLSADGATAVFLINQGNLGPWDLFATRVDGGGPALDIDGDGLVTPTIDGLILMRWQLGVRGTALFGGITFPVGATRTAASTLEDHLRRLTESARGW